MPFHEFSARKRLLNISRNQGGIEYVISEEKTLWKNLCQNLPVLIEWLRKTSFVEMFHFEKSAFIAS